MEIRTLNIVVVIRMKWKRLNKRYFRDRIDRSWTTNKYGGKMRKETGIQKFSQNDLGECQIKREKEIKKIREFGGSKNSVLIQMKCQARAK